MIEEYLMPFVYLFVEMAPYLILGFFIAGLLHAFVPQKLYHKWLGGSDARSVVLSILLGVPLPLCSCGVIPAAVGMRKAGASKGAVTAFLIATPQTGVDSIAATYSIFGLPFAVIRPVVALVTGFFGGIAVNVSEKIYEKGNACVSSGERDMDVWGKGDDGPSCATFSGSNFASKCSSALKYGFGDMVQDIGRWLVLGLLIAGIITVFVPDGFFTSYSGSRILNLFVVLLIAAPMYVCATGSIPIAAALMLKGLSPGAALVFLMAGPATNVASMLILGKTLGRKPLIIYLASIISGALIFGFLVDNLLPAGWFTIVAGNSFSPSCCHTESVSIPWWKTASAIILAILLVRALYMRLHKSDTKITKSNIMKYRVKGMACNHCKANVGRCLSAMDGVVSVNVDLVSGIAEVEGTASPEAVVAAVESLGYGCEILQ
ncbi:MAG: SO_0444 family Cu/Zn efflux transporter [Bacteroides sp.]|nr:SO_0444 family Cu/Zn efflux transporter [Bacteroides sp.]